MKTNIKDFTAGMKEIIKEFEAVIKKYKCWIEEVENAK